MYSFNQLGGFLLILAFFIGCSTKKELNYETYLDYIKDEEKGLAQRITEEGFYIEAIYKPSWLIAHQNLKNPNDQLQLDSLKAALDKYRYFVLTISKDGKDLETYLASTGGDFYSKINNLTHAFPAAIKYRFKGETEEYPIFDYVYSRSFGITRSSFLLVFEIEDLNKDIELIIPDSSIGFGKAIIAFSYKKLTQTPYLKL